MNAYILKNPPWIILCLFLCWLFFTFEAFERLKVGFWEGGKSEKGKLIVICTWIFQGKR